jgi:hypothetical protein
MNTGFEETDEFNKKIKYNEENSSNLIINCMNSNSYCFNINDYFKKILHFSQIDFHYSYLQILDCFNPKEL